MKHMSLKDIKKYIHEKYPGKFTDDEIENIPIILIDEYESQSSGICEADIDVKDTGENPPYDIDEYNFPYYTRALFIRAF